MNIKILPPDVNKSALGFAPEVLGKYVPANANGTLYHGAIRYGLAAIVDIRKAAINAAIAERNAKGPFSSLKDFCARVDSKIMNKKELECLVGSGAFDSTDER